MWLKRNLEIAKEGAMSLSKLVSVLIMKRMISPQKKESCYF